MKKIWKFFTTLLKSIFRGQQDDKQEVSLQDIQIPDDFIINLILIY